MSRGHEKELQFLRNTAHRLRILSIKMTAKAGSGYPTSCLSRADADRGKTPVLYENNEEFPIGGAKILKQSSSDHAGVIATGYQADRLLFPQTCGRRNYPESCRRHRDHLGCGRLLCLRRN